MLTMVKKRWFVTNDRTGGQNGAKFVKSNKLYFFASNKNSILGALGHFVILI